MVIEACIPYGTAAGNYSGVIEVTHQAPPTGINININSNSSSNNSNNGNSKTINMARLVARVPVRLEVSCCDSGKHRLARWRRLEAGVTI